MNFEARLNKIENAIGGNDKDILYIIDPFSDEGQEVTVSGIDIEHHTISITEFEAMNIQHDEIIVIDPFSDKQEML